MMGRQIPLSKVAGRCARSGTIEAMQSSAGESRPDQRRVSVCAREKKDHPLGRVFAGRFILFRCVEQGVTDHEASACDKQRICISAGKGQNLRRKHILRPVCSHPNV